jgi:hypothetical protein
MHWDSRTALPNLDSPGVYLLAHFQQPPSGPASPLDPAIVYIGETHGKNLKHRWSQFHRAAFCCKDDGHSGGISYRQRFGARIDDLYVSAFPVERDSLGIIPASYYTLYVERTLLWDYVRRHGHERLCNKG